MPSDRTFVIVGASLAGATAAETLRSEGFDGRVVLVGSELHRPYERPPLSKGYLRGEDDTDKVYVHPEAFYADQGIELRLGHTATRLDTALRTVQLDHGELLRYDQLLLATGAEPRRLEVPGADLDGVCYLRTLDDADALRDRIVRGGRLVVVGAGWIGTEIAASARQLDQDVTMIAPDQVPLQRVLGRDVGAIYRDIHADHGVQLLLGTGVEALEGDGTVERVRTSDGRTVDCDLVVVGIGVTPRVDLAARAGISVGNGVLVDEQLATSAPGVYAAGDIANPYHSFYDAPIRVEHWANALHQGPVAARSMLGQAAVYDRLPYFFSDQYDVGMEYAGYAHNWDKVVLRGDPNTRQFIAFWLQDGGVVAGMNVNVWDVNNSIQHLIESRATVDEQRLADPGTPLTQLAATDQHDE